MQGNTLESSIYKTIYEELSNSDNQIEIIKEFPKAKVLMCSAMGQESMVIESVRSGAKGFIVKPFVAEKVIAEVQKLIG